MAMERKVPVIFLKVYHHYKKMLIPCIMPNRETKLSLYLPNEKFAQYTRYLMRKSFPQEKKNQKPTEIVAHISDIYPCYSKYVYF